jgi:hypothetical protein
MLVGSMRPGVRVSALGDEDRGEHEERHEHRHRHEEHRAPPEVLEQDAADDRPERGAGREHRRPDGDGEPPLVAVGEDAPQQRQRRGHEHRAEDAHRGARRDQQLGVGRERRERRDGGEPGRADEQHPSPSETVAERAHRDEQSRQHERIGVDDPQLLRARGLEVECDRRQREAQHRVVDRDEQHRQHEDDECGPAAPADALLVLRADRCRDGARGHFFLNFYTVQPV